MYQVYLFDVEVLYEQRCVMTHFYGIDILMNDCTNAM